ncbi:MAG: LCP family protein [Lachnospiraceae bacterium]
MADKKINNRKERLKRRKILIVTGEIMIIAVVFLMCYGASIIGKVQWGDSKEEFYQPNYATKEVGSGSDKDANEGESKQDQEVAANSQVHAEIIEDYSQFTKEYTTFLAVGMDTRANSNLLDKTNNSDVIMIGNLNNKTKEVRLVSIYRDTYMRIFSNGEYDKANRQTSLTNVSDLVNMLNYNLDLSIDYYVVVNWVAMVNAVNVLGGIDMYLTDEEVGYGNEKADINGYISTIVENTGVPSTGIFEGGQLHLDGVQTVAYCRIRYVGYDYARTERQRKVIEQMLVKAKQIDDLGTFTNLVDQVLPNVGTNMTETEILSYLKDIKNYNITAQSTFPSKIYSDERNCGNIPVTYAVVADDFAANVTALHEFLFDVTGYEPTNEVKEVSNYIKEISGWNAAQNE